MTFGKELIMRKPVKIRLFASVLMIMCLLMGTISVSAAEDTNTKPMRLSMKAGTVVVMDSSNKPQKVVNNMEILSGYYIVTNPSSYAWINLDDSKLVKMDALSKTRVTKNNKNLLVDLISGSAFLDVSKNLEKDESLLIRTPNVIASVTGSSAEIGFKNGKTQIMCLDGKIDGYTMDMKTGKVITLEAAAGKNISVENTAKGLDVKSNPVKNKDIPGFVKLQIVQNPLLKERVVNSLGVNSLGKEVNKIDLTDALVTMQKDINVQLAEIETVASNASTDNQSVINSMLGVNMSEMSASDSAATTTSSPSGVSDEAASDSVAADSSSSSDISEGNPLASIFTSDNPYLSLSELFASVSAATDDSSSSSSSSSSNNPTPDDNKPAPDDNKPAPDDNKEEHVHEWELEIIQKEAGCTEDGVALYKCKSCQETKTEPISSTGHSLTGTAIVRTVSGEDSSLCTDIVVAEYKECSNCKKEIEVSRKNKYNSHNYSSVADEIEPPTTISDKKEIYFCTNDLGDGRGICTHKDIRVIPGTKHVHEWELESVQKEASCTEDGIGSYKCKGCLETKTDSINATGHKFIGDPIDGEIVEGANSDVCLDIKYAVYRYCDNCKINVKIDPKHKYDAHNFEELVEKEGTAPTCMADEKLVYRCTNRLIHTDSYSCTWTNTVFREGTRDSNAHPDDSIRELTDKSDLKRHDPEYPNNCRITQCTACNKIWDPIEHVVDESGLPAQDEGAKYILCNNCSIYAEYVWDNDQYKHNRWVDTIPTP